MNRGVGKPSKLLLCGSGGSKEFVSATSKPLQNIYEAEERSRDAAVFKMEAVQNAGGRGVTRTLCLRNT